MMDRLDELQTVATKAREDYRRLQLADEILRDELPRARRLMEAANENLRRAKGVGVTDHYKAEQAFLRDRINDATGKG